MAGNGTRVDRGSPPHEVRGCMKFAAVQGVGIAGHAESAECGGKP
jgi:hypothetical protein